MTAHDEDGVKAALKRALLVAEGHPQPVCKQRLLPVDDFVSTLIRHHMTVFKQPVFVVVVSDKLWPVIRRSALYASAHFDRQASHGAVVARLGGVWSISEDECFYVVFCDGLIDSRIVVAGRDSTDMMSADLIDACESV